MLNLLTRLFGTRVSAPLPVSPTRPTEQLPHLAKLTEYLNAVYRKNAVDRERYLLERQEQARVQQQPGELWLHTPDGPRRAVARFPRQQQGAASDNKLVLGGAGSGRGLMLARLAETAHAAGNHVVVINNFGVNPYNPGALWKLAEHLRGSFTCLKKPEELRFNPFWIPDTTGKTWRIPTQEETDDLAVLLANILRLTRYEVPVDEQELERWLARALSDYFIAGVTPAVAYPSFAGFSAWLDELAERAENRAGQEWEWFRQLRQPFIEEGALAGLLNATPEQIKHLVGAPGRMLYIELSMDTNFVSEADTLDFSARAWPHRAPQALTRALMLLLYTVDMWLGQKQQRLTVVADELHYDAMGTRMASYLERYLNREQHYNRELLVGWHESPGGEGGVFSPENPGTRLILQRSGTQLLLPNFNARGEYYAPLELSAEEAEAMSVLSSNKWTVVVRRPGVGHEVYTAELAYNDLEIYLPEFYKRSKYPLSRL